MPGPEYAAMNPERRARMEEAQEEAGVQTAQKTEEAEFPKHTGGGWYELSSGEKVQGKEDAEKAESKLT